MIRHKNMQKKQEGLLMVGTSHTNLHKRVAIPPILIQNKTKKAKKATKVEILPKKVILMVAIREMKAVMATLPASLPKTKMP